MTSFGVALLVYQVSQLGWLLFASREMSTANLAAVLTATAIFALLFLVVDNGTSFLGARLAARRELDPGNRASITRVRLALAVPGGLLGEVVALSGGLRTAIAFAPYALALVLAGALNTWERWGRGDPIPMAFWIALRGGGLVGLAAVIRLAGARLPLWAPGTVECAIILCVSLAFGLELVRGTWAALRARPGPWRSAGLIGMPTVLGQLALSSGVVLLNAAGLVAAAATFAVGVRIVGGLNNGAVLLSSSLFPRLARGDAAESRIEPAAAALLIRLMQLTVVGIGSAGTAAACFAHRAVVDAFLGSGHSAADGALIAILAAAAATGSALSLAAVLVARDRERDVFRATLAGAALTVLAGVTVVTLADHAVATWMGACLVCGALLAVALLSRAARQLSAAERVTARVGLSGASLAVVAALPAIATSSAAVGSGIAEAGISAGAFAAAVRVGRRVRGREPRARRGRIRRHLHGQRLVDRPALGSPAIVLALPALAATAALVVVKFPGAWLVPATAVGAIALSGCLLGWGARRAQLLSPPVIMGVPLLLGLAAAMSAVTKTHWNWDGASLATSWGIALAPLAGMLSVMVLSGAPRYAGPGTRDAIAPPDAARLVWTCASLVVLGVGVQLITFAQHGAIPLLSSSIDATRVSFQHTGPLYLLSDGLMLSAIVASWARFGWRDHFSSGQRRVLTAIVLFVPLFLTLQGGRFVAAAPAIAAFVAARPYLSKRVVRRVGVVAAMCGAMLSIVLLGVRFHQDPQQNPLTQRTFYTASGSHRGFAGVLWNGLLINLGEGYRVADEFRRSELSLPSPSTSVYFAHRFLPQARDPQPYALALSGLWNNSTYAGPIILDEGVLAAFVFGLALGAVLQYVYVRRARAEGPFFWWLYAYLAANFAFLFYVELPSLEVYLWLDPFALYALYRYIMPPARRGLMHVPGHEQHSPGRVHLSA